VRVTQDLVRGSAFRRSGLRRTTDELLSHGSPSNPCTPEGSGVRFIVKDGAGETIATHSAEIGEGTIVGGDVDPETGVNCDVGTFTIPDVPESDFYQLEVEGVSNSITSSAAELEGNDWTFEVIGDP